MNQAVKVSADCQPPDKCSQAIEGEGGEPPMEQRIWGVELGLRRQNLEAAHNAEVRFHVASHVTDNNDALFLTF